MQEGKNRLLRKESLILETSFFPSNANTPENLFSEKVVKALITKNKRPKKVQFL